MRTSLKGTSVAGGIVGQTKHAFTDDVALDLIAAATDRIDESAKRILVGLLTGGRGIFPQQRFGTEQHGVNPRRAVKHFRLRQFEDPGYSHVGHPGCPMSVPLLNATERRRAIA